jgi:hypothetical protein
VADANVISAFGDCMMCRTLVHDLGGRGLVLLHQGLRRKEKQHSLNPNISPSYLFLSLSIPLSVPLSFLDVGKEVRERWIV